MTLTVAGTSSSFSERRCAVTVISASSELVDVLDDAV